MNDHDPNPENRQPSTTIEETTPDSAESDDTTLTNKDTSTTSGASMDAGAGPIDAVDFLDDEKILEESNQHDSTIGQKPYLKVFGPDTGVFDYELGEGTITVGRSENVDIRLPHHTVSRIHATISRGPDGHYILEDANSNYGTVVNNSSKRVESHILRHGDSIQISLYVLQFRTHQTPSGAAAASAKARLLLRSKFCLLPSTMRLKYRTLEVAPREIFRTGDTLKVGHGGLLVPTTYPPGNATCLELQLFWPNHKSRRYLGEVLGAFEQDGMHWMCVKLHAVPRELYNTIVNASQPGLWADVIAT